MMNFFAANPDGCHIVSVKFYFIACTSVVS